MTTTLLHGDCRAILPTLPDASVQCVVTSPPYFGLRNYGVDGQIGLEPTPAEYVAALVAVFREVRRVLRDDGVVFLNLGDSYVGGGKGGNPPDSPYAGFWGNAERERADFGGALPIPAGFKPKDLIGIPWRVAFALQDDGWWLRSDIIWHKPNAMPESVTDRPTRAHEYVFLLTKNARYSYDAAAVAEPAVNGDPAPPRGARGGAPDGVPLNAGRRDKQGESGLRRYAGFNARWDGRAEPLTTRNRRTVWSVPTSPYKEAHFAVMPEALAEPCILAGSAAQACPVCGAPWVRLVEKETTGRTAQNGQGNGVLGASYRNGNSHREPLGFRPGCTCAGNDGSGRSIVLDPFAGSGTVLRVAERLGRDSIGIDLNPQYIDMQERRTNGVQRVMTEVWE